MKWDADMAALDEALGHQQLNLALRLAYNGKQPVSG